MREMSSVVEGGSQAGQDLFAFRICGRGGRYVDLGAGHYRDGSNTFQLERTLGWSGIAAEIDSDLRSDWSIERPNTLMFDDALDEARKIRYMNDRMHFEHAEEFNNREKES